MVHLGAQSAEGMPDTAEPSQTQEASKFYEPEN